MLYTVDNRSKFNLFTCSRYRFRKKGVDSLHGRAFIAMERLEGERRKERLGRGGLGPPAGARSAPLPSDTLLDLAIPIAAGLEAADGKGIVHRDAKRVATVSAVLTVGSSGGGPVTTILLSTRLRWRHARFREMTEDCPGDIAPGKNPRTGKHCPWLPT